MKYILTAIIFGIGYLSAFHCYALGHLTATLKSYTATQPSLPSSSIIELTLTNDGDRIIEVVSDDIPWVNKYGVITNSSIVIKDVNGKEARYKGIMLDRVDHRLRTTTIEPGEKVVRLVDVPKNYAVIAGVRYVASFYKGGIRYLDRPRSDFRNQSDDNLISLMREAVVQPFHFVADKSYSPESVRLQSEFLTQSCDESQVAIFQNSLSQAASISWAAFNEHSSQFEYSIDPVTMTVVGSFSPSPRYTNWFGFRAGTFDPLNVPPLDQEIDDSIFAVAYRLRDTDRTIPPITLTCRCLPEEVNSETTMAWVREDVHYEINACPSFWVAEDFPTVPNENSRVGTIFHEISHFLDGIWGGSSDLHPAPTYNQSLDLAVNNRALVVRNADTYKFYFLNQVF
ncbi:M35 family metallo-endopeptidase [Pseudoxanthomonas wuyuanensis]|uniref:Lysine-specific metallo-endopeptidase n=1 Tax=Pseudoxanthomonas wuyuanensis TaxID=1073196 RepID=A0A286D9M4_9GAMM|nr:M35 family metallo-endopeptidase [Pseudoxanthomonas wuyuanensis]KAF1718783.1 hypothetical protein CSC75_17910 [Pseudoxanthomonas wuyuanensis]SOD55361.1 Lysine-specific metallo-endopeptidase [Pseudoxanthomonas wuyuanensis]